jgi:hypothetical protein
MKKILLALFLTICAFLLFLPAAKAEVYGYDLTVLGKIGSSNVKNGSNVDRLALGNDLVVTLRVIDPANSNNSPKVTSWEINVLSYSADGKAILSTVNGYWSYTASSSNNINNLTLRLNSVSGIKIDDYSVAMGKLFRWLQSAIELREEDVIQRREHIAKLKEERQLAIDASQERERLRANDLDVARAVRSTDFISCIHFHLIGI